MFAPHAAKGAELIKVGGAAKGLLYHSEFFGCKAKLFGSFCGNFHIAAKVRGWGFHASVRVATNRKMFNPVINGTSNLTHNFNA